MWLLVKDSLIEALPPPQRLALAYAPARRARRRLRCWRSTPGWPRSCAGGASRSPRSCASPGGATCSPSRRPLAARRAAARRAARLARSGVPGGAADGWEALLADELTPAAIAEFVDGRGQAFAALARELGVERGGRRGRGGADLGAGRSRGQPLRRRRAASWWSSYGRSLRRAAAPAGVAAAARGARGARRRGAGARRRRAARRSAAAMLLALRIGLTGR